MPAGPRQTDQTKGHDVRVLDRLAGLGGGGRTGSPRGDGRYGLLLLVLIGTYLFSAFNGRHLTTEVQIGLFAVVLLLAMHSSPLSGRSIAVMEALTGQVFLATLVARLVSAYRSPSPRLRPGPRGRDRLPEYVDGPGDDEDRD